MWVARLHFEIRKMNLGVGPIALDRGIRRQACEDAGRALEFLPGSLRISGKVGYGRQPESCRRFHRPIPRFCHHVDGFLCQSFGHRPIAGVLGALDDKIELNRQMNRTLEAVAQALQRLHGAFALVMPATPPPITSTL